MTKLNASLGDVLLALIMAANEQGKRTPLSPAKRKQVRSEIVSALAEALAVHGNRVMRIGRLLGEAGIEPELELETARFCVIETDYSLRVVERLRDTGDPEMRAEAEATLGVIRAGRVKLLQIVAKCEEYLEAAKVRDARNLNEEKAIVG